MKQHDYTGLVPAQYTGSEIEADASVELANELEAKNLYEVVKKRLLTVNDWHHLAGMVSATFQLVGPGGEEVSRQAQKGDFLRIDIPGPGSKEGQGFDWVRIEAVKEVVEGDVQSMGFRVRPGENPGGEKNATAHFYSDEGTSSFIVTREKLKITAWIVDSNIKPNDHATSLMDKLRNTTVGISALGMFSKVQWQNLANGLVKTIDRNDS